MKRRRTSIIPIKNVAAVDNIGSPKKQELIEISSKIKRYLELASRIALHSEFCHKHGCVLVKSGAVISASFNKAVYNRFADRFRFQQSGIGTRHAEIGALLGLPHSTTSGADIYVVRVRNDGKLGLSYPCEMCIEVARFCNIKRIIYSINEKSVGIVKL